MPRHVVHRSQPRQRTANNLRDRRACVRPPRPRVLCGAQAVGVRALPTLDVKSTMEGSPIDVNDVGVRLPFCMFCAEANCGGTLSGTTARATPRSDARKPHACSMLGPFRRRRRSLMRGLMMGDLIAHVGKPPSSDPKHGMLVVLTTIQSACDLEVPPFQTKSRIVREPRKQGPPQSRDGSRLPNRFRACGKGVVRSSSSRLCSIPRLEIACHVGLSTGF